MAFSQADCCLIVSTCDRYVGLLPNFFLLLNKYFDSNIGSIGITSESYEWNNGHLEKRKRKNNGEWSERLIREINSFNNCKYVLLLLDDYYLESKVDNSILIKGYNLLSSSNKNVVVYFDSPYDRKTYTDTNHYPFVRIKRSLFRASACPSLWKKDFLVRLLRANENAWQFEYRGSFRANLSIKNFYCLDKNVKHPFVFERGGLVNKGVMNEEYARRIESKEKIVIERLPNFKPHESKRKVSIFRFFKNRLLLFASLFVIKRVR